MGLHNPEEIENALNNAEKHCDYLRNLIRFVLDGDIKFIEDGLTGKKYSIKIEEIKEENENDD